MRVLIGWCRVVCLSRTTTTGQMQSIPRYNFLIKCYYLDQRNFPGTATLHLPLLTQIASHLELSGEPAVSRSSLQTRSHYDYGNAQPPVPAVSCSQT